MVKTKVVTSRPRDPPAGVVLPARGSKQNFASSTLPLYVEGEQTARDIRSMTVWGSRVKLLRRRGPRSIFKDAARACWLKTLFFIVAAIIAIQFFCSLGPRSFGAAAIRRGRCKTCSFVDDRGDGPER